MLSTHLIKTLRGILWPIGSNPRSLRLQARPRVVIKAQESQPSILRLFKSRRKDKGWSSRCCSLAISMASLTSQLQKWGQASNSIPRPRLQPDYTHQGTISSTLTLSSTTQLRWTKEISFDPVDHLRQSMICTDLLEACKTRLQSAVGNVRVQAWSTGHMIIRLRRTYFSHQTRRFTTLSITPKHALTP